MGFSVVSGLRKRWEELGVKGGVFRFEPCFFGVRVLRTTGGPSPGGDPWACSAGWPFNAPRAHPQWARPPAAGPDFCLTTLIVSDVFTHVASVYNPGDQSFPQSFKSPLTGRAGFPSFFSVIVLPEDGTSVKLLTRMLSTSWKLWPEHILPLSPNPQTTVSYGG